MVYLKKNLKNDFDFKSALIIGFLQILSLVPGVSRSGIAITIARLLKFKRPDAAKISFLISIPILAAVSIFGLQNMENLMEKFQTIFTRDVLYCQLTQN